MLLRIINKKEDTKRIKERFGIASIQRDFSKSLIWIHCASVGESLSILTLVKKLLKENKDLNILVTTGTITSSKLMAKNLPERAFHQFIPIDLTYFVKRFLNHWKPELSIFVESELWPNLVDMAPNKILINARMSDRSYRRYKKFPNFSQMLLNGFDAIFTQSKQDYGRFKELCSTKIIHSGNLKYDVNPPKIDSGKLKIMQESTSGKKILIAISTHAKEESAITDIYQNLSKKIENLILIIVPRHPERGDEVTKEIKDKGFEVHQRSKKEYGYKKGIYIADTIGEMGIWFTIADAIIMGGSLIPHGGHNPIEPLKFGKPTITGKHMHDFREMVKIMQELDIIYVCENDEEITSQAYKVLTEDQTEFSKKAIAGIESLTGATNIIIDYINSALKG